MGGYLDRIIEFLNSFQIIKSSLLRLIYYLDFFSYSSESEPENEEAYYLDS